MSADVLTVLVTCVGFVRGAVSGFLTGSPTYLTADASPASASSGGAPSKPNGGAIAGGVIGALLAVLLAGTPTCPKASSPPSLTASESFAQCGGQVISNGPEAFHPKRRHVVREFQSMA